MANIDFALRTLAGSVAHWQRLLLFAADSRCALLLLDEFWGDAAPEKAPSTRVNRATTIRTPTKKSCCTVCTMGRVGFGSLKNNSFQISLILDVVENLNVRKRYSQEVLGIF